MENQQNKFLAVTYKLYTGNDRAEQLIEEATQERPFVFLSGFGVALDAFDDIEYYAVMGSRDPSYLITSHSYGSVDDMCKALPEGCGKGIRNALEKGLRLS